MSAEQVNSSNEAERDADDERLSSTGVGEPEQVEDAPEGLAQAASERQEAEDATADRVRDNAQISAEEAQPDEDVAEAQAGEDVADGSALSEGQASAVPEPSEERVEAAEAPASDRADEQILGRLDAIAERQEKLSELVDDKFRFDEVRDNTIDRLHKEVQDHRDDMLAKVMLPVLRDLIRLNDHLLKFVDAWRKKPEEKRDWERLLDNMATFGDDIVDILDRYGLTAFTEDGDIFNPRRQRAIAIRSTQDPDADKTIAERLRPGFQWGESLIRNEEVVIYKYQPSGEGADDASENGARPAANGVVASASGKTEKEKEEEI